MCTFSNRYNIQNRLGENASCVSPRMSIVSGRQSGKVNGRRQHSGIRWYTATITFYVFFQKPPSSERNTIRPYGWGVYGDWTLFLRTSHPACYPLSWASGRGGNGGGLQMYPMDFGNVLITVLIILVFIDNKWLWNYQNDLKNAKHIKILTLLAFLFL